MKIKYIGHKPKIHVYRPFGVTRKTKDVFVFEQNKVYEFDDVEAQKLLDCDAEYLTRVTVEQIQEIGVTKLENGQYRRQKSFIEVKNEEEEKEEVLLEPKRRGRPPKEVISGDTFDS